MMTLSFTIPFTTITKMFIFEVCFSSWRQPIAFGQPRARHQSVACIETVGSTAKNICEIFA